MKVLQVERMDGMYRELTRDGDPTLFLERLFAKLGVEIRASEPDLAQIPKTGAVLAVVNHPFGIVEGAALAYLLPRIRPDVKIMANFLLRQFPEIEDKIITVDPFGGPESWRANLRGLRECRTWLDQGGMLVVFPAGEVSQMQIQFPRFAVEDPAWSATIARLLRHTDACALPMFIDGRNSALFHLAGLVHPRLRTALLPHEFLNKQSRPIELRCAAPIASARLHAFESDQKLTQHLRWRTYMLAHRDRPRKRPMPFLTKSVATALPKQAVLRELQRGALIETAEYSVYAVRGKEIPVVMQEIGRLRESTFRAVGEGTGKARDLDHFDPHYHQIILFDKAQQEIAGAYRLGVVDEIVPKYGLKGLYTHSLFAFQRDFLARMGPAIELGRSFIRPEYQRSYQPLLMLWKGIGKFVLDHAPAHVLFGPVSVSGEYARASRELIASVLSRQNGNPELAKFVRARKPLKTKLTVPASCDFDELGDLIVDLEADRKPMPVLLRQYLKMGGQLLAFNVDPKFNHCLDGLIVVDLVQTDTKLLDRYMGAEGRKAFLNQNRERGAGTLPHLVIPNNRPV
jgi:putative hemolysin